MRRRAAPLIVLALAVGACAGRSVVPPTVADAYTGRIPPIPSTRVLGETITRSERVTGVRVPILLYHRIAELGTRLHPGLTVDPFTFSDQMNAIAKSGATTLTVSELLEAARKETAFPNGAVAITFDDATEDQYLYAFPLLQQLHLRATFYVPTGRVGRPGYLTWPQIKTMYSSGLIEIGAHTITHRDLTKLSRGEAWSEIAGSRAVLEKFLRAPVMSFAYPFGTFGAREEAMVRLAGFTSAVTTAYAWTHPLQTALTWGRMEVHVTNAPGDLAGLAQASGDLHTITTTVDAGLHR